MPMFHSREWTGAETPNPNLVGKADWNDAHVWNGELTSGGGWTQIPSVFRLRLTGTGTVTMDARNSLGEITSAVETYTVTGATNQIEFPYAGDDAVEIRVTLTGTATAEVI